MPDLYQICELAGVLIILVAVVSLSRQKVYLDAATKQVINVEVDLPLIGKLKTNSPLFAVFFIGFAALVIPLFIAHTKYITVEQEISSDSQFVIDAYAVAKQTTVGKGEHLQLFIPDLPEGDYQPHLVLHVGTAFRDINIDKSKMRDGKIILPKISLQNLAPEPILNTFNQPNPGGFIR